MRKAKTIYPELAIEKMSALVICVLGKLHGRLKNGKALEGIFSLMKRQLWNLTSPSREVLSSKCKQTKILFC